MRGTKAKFLIFTKMFFMTLSALLRVKKQLNSQIVFSKQRANFLVIKNISVKIEKFALFPPVVILVKNSETFLEHPVLCQKFMIEGYSSSKMAFGIN